MKQKRSMIKVSYCFSDCDDEYAYFDSSAMAEEFAMFLRDCESDVVSCRIYKPEIVEVEK